MVVQTIVAPASRGYPEALFNPLVGDSLFVPQSNLLIPCYFLSDYRSLASRLPRLGRSLLARLAPVQESPYVRGALRSERLEPRMMLAAHVLDGAGPDQVEMASTQLLDVGRTESAQLQSELASELRIDAIVDSLFEEEQQVVGHQQAGQDNAPYRRFVYAQRQRDLRIDQAATTGPQVTEELADSRSIHAKPQGPRGPPAAESVLPASILLLVDEGLQDYATFGEQLATTGSTEILYLSTETDGVQQISEILGSRGNISQLHIYSHGQPGSIRLGTETLDLAGLEGPYRDQVLRWRKSFDADADIFVYGCRVADGPAGIEFVQALGQAAGTNVAASSDVTGAERLGGDWVLESTFGDVDETLVRRPEREYAGTLPSPLENTGAEASPIYQVPDGVTEVRLAQVGTAIILSDESPVPLFADTTVVDATDVTSLTIELGSGGDTLQVEALTILTDETLIVSGGDGADTIRLGSAWAPTLELQLEPGGSTDVVDFAAATSPLTVVPPSGGYYGLQSGSQVVSIPTLSPVSIINADFALPLAEYTQPIEQSLAHLSAFLLTLESAGEFATSLPILDGSTEDVTLGGALGLREALNGVDNEVRKFLEEVPDPTFRTRALGEHLDDLFADAANFSSLYQGPVIIGVTDIQPPAEAVELSFDVTLTADTGVKTATIAENIAAGSSVTEIADAISAQLTLNTDFAGRIRAVPRAVGEDDPNRIGFEVVDPDVIRFSIQPDAAATTLGFAGGTLENADQILQKLGPTEIRVGEGLQVELTLRNGMPTLLLGFEYEVSRDSSFSTQLGVESKGYGITFDTDQGEAPDLNAAATLYLRFNIALDLSSPADATLNIDALRAGLHLDAYLESLALRVGFLGATGQGSLDLDAGLALAAPLADIASMNPDDVPAISFVSVDADGTGAPSFDVSLALEALPPAPVLSATLAANGNPFSGKNISLNASAGFTHFTDFNNLTPADTISSIGHLRDWLESVRQGPAIDSLSLPLVDGALEAVLDLSEMVSDQLLYDDETGTEKLVDEKNRPTFDTAQELSDRLSAILGVSDFRYEVATRTLYYDISFSAAPLPSVTLPIDFALDLPPLGKLSSDTQLTLEASGALNLALGFDLSEASGAAAEPLQADTLLSDLGVYPKLQLSRTGATAPRTVVGVLDEDATFDVTIGNVTYTVTIPAETTSDNTTVSDLVASVNEALEETTISPNEQLEFNKLCPEEALGSDCVRAEAFPFSGSGPPDTLKFASAASFTIRTPVTGRAFRELGIDIDRSATELAGRGYEVSATRPAVGAGRSAGGGLRVPPLKSDWTCPAKRRISR